MDTKLRNSHNRITVSIIIAAILIPAVILVALNPFFAKKAEQENSSAGSETAFSEQQSIIQSSYVLYAQEIMKKSDTDVPIEDIFYPSQDKKGISRFTDDVSNVAAGDAPSGDYEIAPADPPASGNDEAYTSMYGYTYEDFVDTLQSQYRVWEHNFYSLRDFVSCQVYDGSGKLLSSNENKKTDLRKLMKEDAGQYAFGAAISYNENGKMTVSDVYGDNPASSEELLLSAGRSKPLQVHTGVKSDLFQTPKNRTYVYAMTNAQFSNYVKDVVNLGQDLYPVMGIAITISYILALLCAIAALALVLIKPVTSRYYRIFQAPCAFALAGGFFSLLFTWPEGILFASHDALQSLKYSLNLEPTAASALVYTAELLAWLCVFALLFWSVSCLAAVFTLGPKRYWKERTLIYKIYAWFKKWAMRIYLGISNFDLRSNINRTILKLIGINFLILLVLCSFWFYGVLGLIVYSVILFFILRKYAENMRDKYQVLLNATNAIADGNLDVAISEDLGIFNPLKGEITKIQSGFKKAVQNEVKSQRMKTDLITNVSHDLKTPLTAIITYVNLLKDETDEGRRRSYIDVLEQKSLRLKSLIEDLFEISKATSNNVSMNFMTVDIVDLLKQVSFELSDKIESSSIDFRWKLPEEKVLLSLDSQKTYRIFENLLVNIAKYAMPGTRAYVSLDADGTRARIIMKNVSAAELAMNPQDLTDRFVRGDASRNTEGSGLGLAIAKSFVELQSGTLQVDIDADLFTVIICFPQLEKSSNPPKPESKEYSEAAFQGGGFSQANTGTESPGGSPPHMAHNIQSAPGPQNGG